MRPLNGVIYRFTISLARVLNVEVNNEAIAFHGFDFLHHMNMGDDMYSHDKTPSALVAYLALFSGVTIVIILIRLAVRCTNKKTRAFRFPIGFAISSWLSFGFIMALLRWQPWGTRLLYPALSVTVITSAAMLQSLAVTIGKKNEKRKVTAEGSVIILLAALSIVLCIPSITYNLKPAIDNAKGNAGSRTEQYFVFNRRYDSFKKMTDLAKEKDVRFAAIIISGDGYDYPIWRMIKDEIPEAEMEQLTVVPAWDEIKVDNTDGTAGSEMPIAIIISEREIPKEGETYLIGDIMYKCVYANEEINDALLLTL